MLDIMTCYVNTAAFLGRSTRSSAAGSAQATDSGLPCTLRVETSVMTADFGSASRTSAAVSVSSSQLLS